MFLFGGRLLELVRVQEMTAYVSDGKGGASGAALERRPHAALQQLSPLPSRSGWMLPREGGARAGPEMALLKPLLAGPEPLVGASCASIAARRSAEKPRRLASVPVPVRRAQRAPGVGSGAWHRVPHRAPANTFSIAVNDYGFELLSSKAGLGRTVAKHADLAG